VVSGSVMQGAQLPSTRRRRRPGVENREGVHPSHEGVYSCHRTRGAGGAPWASPAGSEAESRLRINLALLQKSAVEEKSNVLIDNYSDANEPTTKNKMKSTNQAS